MPYARDTKTVIKKTKFAKFIETGFEPPVWQACETPHAIHRGLLVSSDEDVDCAQDVIIDLHGQPVSGWPLPTPSAARPVISCRVFNALYPCPRTGINLPNRRAAPGEALYSV